MSDTVIFTGAVDRDPLKRAKIVAARCDTSVNVLLRYLVMSAKPNAEDVTMTVTIMVHIGVPEDVRSGPRRRRRLWG